MKLHHLWEKVLELQLFPRSGVFHKTDPMKYGKYPIVIFNHCHIHNIHVHQVTTYLFYDLNLEKNDIVINIHQVSIARYMWIREPHVYNAFIKIIMNKIIIYSMCFTTFSSFIYYNAMLKLLQQTKLIILFEL